MWPQANYMKTTRNNDTDSKFEVDRYGRSRSRVYLLILHTKTRVELFVYKRKVRRYLCVLTARYSFFRFVITKLFKLINQWYHSICLRYHVVFIDKITKNVLVSVLLFKCILGVCLNVKISGRYFRTEMIVSSYVSNFS